MKRLRQEYEKILRENIKLSKENNILKNEKIILFQRFNSLKQQELYGRTEQKKLKRKLKKLINQTIEFNATPMIKNINNLCDYWFLNVIIFFKLKD